MKTMFESLPKLPGVGKVMAQFLYRPHRVIRKGIIYGFAALLAVFCLILIYLQVVLAGQPFGTNLGSFNGVTAFSNGNSGFYSSQSNFVNGAYTGIKWQCVEYVRRYYLTVYNADLAPRYLGHAITWYDNASKMGLEKYPNGGTTAPQVGDILTSNGGPFGHIAIIRSVTNNQVCTIQQNFSNDASDVNRCLNLAVSNGAYTASGFSSSYPIQGWLRRSGSTLPPPCVSGSSENFLVDGRPPVHPNGTLIKKRNDQTYYVLVDGQKRGIPSPDVLHNLYGGENSEFEFNDVVTVSDAEFNSYLTGLPVNSPLPSNGRSQPNGRLIKAPGKSEVSIVSDGKRRPFTDANIFLNLGYVFCNVIEVADYDSYPVGSPVSGRNDIWTSNGPYGGRIYSLAIDPVNPAVLYAGTDRNGGYKSTNGGASWSPMNNGLPTNAYISALAINPANPSTLYAEEIGGVYKSMDGGTSWSRASDGLPNTNLFALALNPANPAVLYVGTSGAGVYKSTDGGASWNPMNNGLPDVFIQALAISPVNPAVLYAGTLGGVYKSTDGGANWSRTSNGLGISQIRALAINPVNPTVLYAGAVYGGVYKSVDEGANWSPMNNGLPTNSYVLSLAINSSNPAVFYAGIHGSGVYKSTDGGTSWSSINNGLPNTSVYALAINSANPAVLYAGTAGGGYKSADGGATWSPMSSGLPNAYVNALAINPINPAVLYAGTFGSGVHRSTDGGASWNPVNNGLSSAYISALAISPADPSVLYTGTLESGVYKTTDGGANWSRASNGLPNSQVRALAVNPANSALLYSETEFSVYKSIDGGANWSSASNGLPNSNLLTLTLNPANSAILYAGAYGGFYKSTNGGASWSPMNNGLPVAFVSALAPNPANPDVLYAGTNGGVYKSTDGGGSWSPMSNGLPANNYVSALALDPANPAVLYAGTFGGGVYKSANGGASWSPMNNGLSSAYINALAISPTGQIVHAGTYEGVFTYHNNGTSDALVVNAISPATPTCNIDDQDVTVIGNGFQQGLTVDVTYPGGGTTLTGTQIKDVTPTSFVMRIKLAGTGAWSIRVKNLDGSQSNKFDFQVQAGPTPTITSINPPNPLVSNIDQQVTINGTNFKPGLTVTVTFPGGSKTLSGAQILQPVTSNSFKALITFGSPGDWSIHVNNPDCSQSSAFPFKVGSSSCAMPTISFIEPPNPTVSNIEQQVTVNGNNFKPGLTVTVTYPGGSRTLSGAKILQPVTTDSFKVFIKLDTPGDWSIRVNNPDCSQLSIFPFKVSTACTLSCTTFVLPFPAVNEPTFFMSQVTTNGCTGVLKYDWDFDDGMHSGDAQAVHTYRRRGDYKVKFTASLPSGEKCVKENSITVITPPVNAPPSPPIGLAGQWGIVNPLAEVNIFLAWSHPNSEEQDVTQYNIYVRKFDPDVDFSCSSKNIPLTNFCLPKASLQLKAWAKIATVNHPDQFVILKDIQNLLKSVGITVDAATTLGLNFSVRAVNSKGESDFSDDFSLQIKGSGNYHVPPPLHPIVFVPGWHGGEETWKGVVDALTSLFGWKEGGIVKFNSNCITRCSPVEFIPISKDGIGHIYKVSFDDPTTAKDEGLDGVQDLSARLGQYLDTILFRTGKDKAIVVGHSAGGVVSRACLQLGGKPCQGKIKRLVTYGSPHKGTILADIAGIVSTSTDDEIQKVIDQLLALKQNLVLVRTDSKARKIFLDELSKELPLFGNLISRNINKQLDEIDHLLIESIDDLIAVAGFIRVGQLGRDLATTGDIIRDLNNCSSNSLPNEIDYVWLVGKWSKLAKIVSAALAAVKHPAAQAASELVKATRETDLFISSDSQNLARASRDFPSVCVRGTAIERDPFFHSFLAPRKFSTPLHFGEGQDYIGVMKGLGFPVLSILPNSPISITVIAPDGSFITPNLSGIPGAAYTLTGGVEIPLPLPGDYKVLATRHPDASPTQTFSIDAEVGGRKTILVPEIQIQDIPADGFSINASNASTDVSIVNSVSSGTALAGATVTYTLTVKNTGPDAATIVKVTDKLPGPTTFVSCSATNGGACNGSGNNRTVTFASLASGASATITIIAKINDSVANGTVIGNTATVSSSTIDPNPNNNSATATLTLVTVPLLVSEFRFSGPSGSGDWFIELYNNADSPLSTTGRQIGIIDATGNTAFSIALTANMTIPPRGYYLVAGPNYSLAGLAAPDQVAPALPLNGLAGVGVFNGPVNNAANRLDSAAFSSVASNVAFGYFREGAGLPPIGNAVIEHSFMRKQTNGAPQDTDNNLNDFTLLSPAGGVINGVQAVLGAPGPQSSTSPMERNATMPSLMLNPNVSASSPPNRERNTTPVPNGALGTLAIRRKFTNNTGAPVKKLRFRVIDITNKPSGSEAELRALSSVDVMINGQPVRGTTLEQPPSQPNGGGMNSTLAVGVITLSNPLPSGASVNVQFLLGVQRGGSFRFFVNVEALN